MLIPKWVPDGHPHMWSERDADRYEAMTMKLDLQSWRRIDDAIYERECTAADCLDHFSGMTTEEYGADDDGEVIEGEVIEVHEDYDPTQPFVVSEWLPSGDPYLWDDYQWGIFETHLDMLPQELADALEDAAADMMGCYSSAEVHVKRSDDMPDLGELANKPLNDLTVDEWNMLQEIESDWWTAAQDGDAWVVKPAGTVTKSSTSGKPKKGDPCTDECRGPGWKPSASWKGATNTKPFNIHLQTCPQHAEYDPTKVFTTSYTPSCVHGREEKFKLEDGLDIFASAYRDVKYITDEAVDIGVYLYSSWAVGTMMATPGIDLDLDYPYHTQQVIVDWPDFSVPKKDVPMVKLVHWILTKLAEGKSLEIGCMGGHGRTGTMLSCLLAAQGLTPGKAIARVRKDHCEKAVENSKQAKYVAEFYKAYHGHENWRGSKAERKLFDEQVKAGHKNSTWGSSKFYKSGGQAVYGYQTDVPLWSKELNLWTCSTYRQGFSWSREHKTYTSTTYTPDITKGGVT